MPTQDVIEALKADLAEGLTYRAISAKRAIPLGTLSVWLKPLKAGQTIGPQTDRHTDRQRPSESVGPVDGTIQTETPSASLQVIPPTELEKARAEARKALGDIAAGRVSGDASRMAALRLLLKDELEPETERNLYAGRSSEELAERSLVLAVSVLGVRKVSALMRSLAQSETLDLGLEWAPSANDVLESAATPQSLETTGSMVKDSVGERSVLPAIPTVQKHSAETYSVETLDG